MFYKGEIALAFQSDEMREIPASDVTLQYDYMSKTAALLAQEEPKYFYVETYGCQQNEADSEVLRGMASEMGYRLCNSASEADLIVFNTCAIREHAEQRVFGNLGALSHLKREKPDLIIAMCGCMAGEASVVERIKRSYPHVSLLFDTHELWRFPEYLYAVLTGEKRVFASSASSGAIAEGLPKKRDRSVKAWLPIMYGCNNFCTYCIVPYVRGRERSRRLSAVLQDARASLSDGAKDITLLGQNVNSYRGLDDSNREIDFPSLLEAVSSLPGDFRVRFMTSHPKDASEKLFQAMSASPKISKHLHLPFQSGSNRILKAMNRGYSAENYLKLIDRARELMPDIVITSDVIIGFPGETKEDFERTMELIERVRFDALFTFIFSPRKGTKAAEMVDETPQEVKKERFSRLVERQNAISAEIHAAYAGRVVNVLVDGKVENKRGFLSARTDGGRLVVFPGESELIGRFVDVRIEDSTTWSLSGSLNV